MMISDGDLLFGATLFTFTATSFSLQLPTT